MTKYIAKIKTEDDTAYDEAMAALSVGFDEFTGGGMTQKEYVQNKVKEWIDSQIVAYRKENASDQVDGSTLIDVTNGV